MKKYLQLIRVSQWIKNIFVFAPLLFSKHLFEADYFFKSSLAFISFCLVSSSVYILNDIVDKEKDKKHPKKKLRPIASGSISIKIASFLALAFLFFSSYLAIKTNIYLFYLIISYFLLNIFYSFLFKNIVILDMMTLAVGFILRVYAGGVVINVEISNWLIISTFFISIFLAAMKRRSELSLVENAEINTRKVLSEYSVYFADLIGAVSASCLLIAYAMYTINDKTINYFGNDYIAFTNIFVAFGIFRFMYLAYKKSKGENATEIMLTDLPMMINLLLYSASIVIIVYFSKYI